MATREQVAAPDGRARCPWALRSSDYIAYHDDEWGRELHGDVALFERIALEGFQSGLSWITILRKRAGFRLAFDGFDPTIVAQYAEADLERLLSDSAIVRNRRKIEATIRNAQALLDLWAAEGDGALDRLVWSYAEDPRRARPETVVEIPASTPASAALSRRLKSLGFVFVGPTTMYALMQACGVVDDHLRMCWVPPHR